MQANNKETTTTITQATTTTSNTSMTTISEVTMDSYKERLLLLNQTPYREYFSAFMATLTQSKLVADAITSGKIELADNRSQQALSYAVSIAADVGGRFVPTGTIAKLIEGVTGYFINKHRKKGYAKVAETTTNPFHFVLLTQALIDCMLFYFDPSWCEGLNRNLAARQGEKDAKLLAKGIKNRKIAFSDDQDLAIRLGACLGYMIRKKVIETEVTYKDWVEGKYAQILVMAAAQMLKLPADQFTKIDELTELYEERFEKLEKKIENVTQKAEWQEKSEEEQSRAIEAEVNAETEGQKVELASKVNEIKESLVGDNLKVAATGRLSVEHNIAKNILSGSSKAISSVKVDSSVTALFAAVSKNSATPSPLMNNSENVVPLLGNNAVIEGTGIFKRNEGDFILSVNDDEEPTHSSAEKKTLQPGLN